MALPDNGHHVHSNGYTSDRGEPDRERMLTEIADEIAEIQAVTDVRVVQDHDGPCVEADLSVDDAGPQIESVADEWGCRYDVGRGWVTITPESGSL